MYALAVVTLHREVAQANILSRAAQQYFRVFLERDQGIAATQSTASIIETKHIVIERPGCGAVLNSLS
jgi:hypothetical protein